VEVTAGQTPAAAMERNRPLLSRQYRDLTQLLYPPDASDLEAGKTYAWQITALSGDYNLGTTEIWTFSTAARDRIPDEEESYRFALEAPDGTLYLAQKGVLRFAYVNRAEAKTLDYFIQSLSTTDKTGIKPRQIDLRPGINKMDINLSAEASLTAGQKYQLVIRQQNGNNQYLDFIYCKHEQ
jgi:hypothetical protein